jgi:hypothetical protein
LGAKQPPSTGLPGFRLPAQISKESKNSGNTSGIYPQKITGFLKNIQVKNHPCIIFQRYDYPAVFARDVRNGTYVGDVAASAPVPLS